MTTTDYLINAVFVLVVLRQARERKVDVRSFLVPMAVVLYVGHMYVHSVPTAGNDLDAGRPAGLRRPGVGPARRVRDPHPALAPTAARSPASAGSPASC